MLPSVAAASLEAFKLPDKFLVVKRVKLYVAAVGFQLVPAVNGTRFDK